MLHVDFSCHCALLLAQKKGGGSLALRLRLNLWEFWLFYVFFTGFFGVRFAGAFFAGAFFSLSRPPIRLNASVELNGNCRTDVSVWPAEFNVTSTRRLLAMLIRTILAIARLRSSVVRSGFCSIDCFTSSVVRLCSLPKALVSIAASGTPFSKEA